MCGFSAVAVASVASAWRSVISVFASIPETHLWSSNPEAAVRSLIESSRLRAISGTRTFSSNWPCEPAIVIAASLPTTWSPTWMTTSGITGLTLPGMIDEPFWSSGRRISASPARGPEPISARSFAILISEIATTFRAPESSTSASRLPCASNGSAGGRMSSPVDSVSAARTRAANSGWVLSPVPVAVPPSGIWPTCPSVARTRSVPRRICAA